MKSTQGRRGFLASIASGAGTIGAAGCITINTGPDAKFRLTSFKYDSGLSEIVEDPLDIRSKFGLDYSDEYKRRKMNKLVDTGTVSTRGWELSYQIHWDDTIRQKHTCLRYDGTYYRPIVKSAEEVMRDTWVFYLDWTVDEPPDTADVATYPIDSLSDQDRRILAAAVESLPSPDRRVKSPDDYNYAVEYHAELDPSSSNLVPEPPFDYVQTDEETFGAVAERVPLTFKEQTFTARSVAESKSGYLEYARETFPDAEFDGEELSDEAQSIVEDVSSVQSAYSYEEEPPLSDGLEEVLGRLGIAERLRPHDEYDNYTSFYDALASYRDQWFEFSLKIYP